MINNNDSMQDNDTLINYNTISDYEDNTTVTNAFGPWISTPPSVSKLHNYMRIVVNRKKLQPIKPKPLPKVVVQKYKRQVPFNFFTIAYCKPLRPNKNKVHHSLTPSTPSHISMNMCIKKKMALKLHNRTSSMVESLPVPCSLHGMFMHDNKMLLDNCHKHAPVVENVYNTVSLKPFHQILSSFKARKTKMQLKNLTSLTPTCI